MLIIAAIKNGYNLDKLVHAIMYAHWVDDANLSNFDDLAKITNLVGLKAHQLIEAELRKMFWTHMTKTLKRRWQCRCSIHQPM